MPVLFKCDFITSKDSLTVSAESSNCGKNFVPFSKSLPTASKAGTIQRSIIDIGLLQEFNNCSVAFFTLSLNPL